MSASPTKPRSTVLLNGPRPTRVAGWSITRPSFCKPMNVMKTPIPAAAPRRRERGIAFTMRSRTPQKVRMRKNTPERKTTPKAVSHETLFPMTSV